MKELTANWKRTFSVQLCLQIDGDLSFGEAIAEAARTNEADEAASANDGDRLSTIIEEASEDLNSEFNEDDQQSLQNFADTYFAGVDLDAVKIIYDALAAETDKDTPVDENFSESDVVPLHRASGSGSEYPPLVGHSYLRNSMAATTAATLHVHDHHHTIHYTQAGIESFNYGSPDLVDDFGNPYVEVGIDRSIAKCFLNDAAMDSGDSVALRIFSTYKQAVIQREANLLTKKELQQHADLAAAAILEELHVWNNHTCFRRRLRSQCHNIMDSRFVAKWKIVIEKGIRKKLLRMRMTLRGFKDLEADRLVKYAATVSRQSQRLISSEAACHDNWIIISIDVNKAFLKGLTYDELAKLTGEPRRHCGLHSP